MTWVLHVDLDQFLASVELRRHPELVGLPVIVGGSGDPTEPRKVVTCASYEAREFGVHAGMPLRTAARKCPVAVFLPSGAPAPDEASQQLMGLLSDLGHPNEAWGWGGSRAASRVNRGAPEPDRAGCHNARSRPAPRWSIVPDRARTCPREFVGRAPRRGEEAKARPRAEGRGAACPCPRS